MKRVGRGGRRPGGGHRGEEPSVEYIQAFGRHVQLIVTYDTRISFAGMPRSSRGLLRVSTFFSRALLHARDIFQLYINEIFTALCGSAQTPGVREKSVFPVYAHLARGKGAA